MGRVELLRKAAGWINYMGSQNDFMDNMKEAIGADNLSDIAEFQAKIKKGQLPPKLIQILKKRQQELMNAKSGSNSSWGQL